MLGLPKSTETTSRLSKNAIYTRFNLNAAAKTQFDDDIKKIVIVNEISAATSTIEKGDSIDSFFVLHVLLKQKRFNEGNIKLISKLINQNMLFILEYEGVAKLAIFHTKLLQAEWMPIKDLTIQLKGYNLDRVWENLITQIGNIRIEEDRTLDEQIAVDEQREKIDKQIAKLEKQAWIEKQPKKKFEFVQEINKLKLKREE